MRCNSTSSNIFDKVYICVAENSKKDTLFSLSERIHLAEKSLHEIKNIEVIGFSGLLVDFAEKLNAKVILRGLRVVSDFEYEFQLANMNRRLNPKLESVFLTPAEENSFISSTLVKEVALHRGQVGGFCHPVVEQALKDRLSRDDKKV